MSEPNDEIAQPEHSTYTTLADYMAMKDGDAAPDDVTIDREDPTSATAEAQAEAPEVAVGEEPAPTPEHVSEAARVLSQQRNETKRERRIRQINEEIAGHKARETQSKAAADAEERRLATLRAERAQLEAAPQQIPVAQPVAVAASAQDDSWPVPPNPEDVGSDKIQDWDDFYRQRSAYEKKHAEKTIAEAERRARGVIAEERQRAEGATAAQAWEGRWKATASKRPDFQSVVFEHADQWSCSPDLAALITKYPAGPEVAYFLATNKEESHRIARLSPDDQKVEFGRLSTSLVPVTAPSKVTGPQSSAKPVSRTPPPAPPVGQASASSQVPAERQRLSDWITNRNAEEARNGRL